MTDRNSTKRGNYTPVVNALLKGADFQTLPGSARWTFYVLKTNASGMAGIDHYYKEELLAILINETGWTRKQIEADLNGLERGRWIKTEGNLLWIVGHLTYDPHAHEKDQNKRKNVQSWVAGLPRQPLVAEFVQAHPVWFPVDECANFGLEWALHPNATESPEGLPEESHESPRSTITNTKTLTLTSRDRSESEGEGVDAFLAEYPQRLTPARRSQVLKVWRARRRAGVDAALMIDGAKRYRIQQEAKGNVGGDYIKCATTFLGQGEHYLADYPLPPQTKDPVSITPPSPRTKSNRIIVGAHP